MSLDTLRHRLRAARTKNGGNDCGGSRVNPTDGRKERGERAQPATTARAVPC